MDVLEWIQRTEIMLLAGVGSYTEDESSESRRTSLIS